MKIFLVEDDPGLRGELAALLGRYGYECAAACDFADVPGQILSSGAHLVVLDLNLPLYDGYHVCREVRKRSQIPIIVVTSRAMRASRIWAL